jgi:hypothetical protein
VETARNSSSLFLLCFIELSHPRFIALFPFRRSLFR